MSRTSTRMVSVDPRRPHLAVLEEAEQHRLGLERQLADLVEEQRAAVPPPRGGPPSGRSLR